jgi:mobilome CxxCx(11)CxxC protein
MKESARVGKSMSESVLTGQKQRLRNARIRSYQTYIIFRHARLAKRGLKILNFLGIAIPLIAGGVVMSLYSDRKPPAIVVVVAGLLGVVQAVGSVWALVDEWDRKSQLSERTAQEFRDLYIQLETIRPGADGLYDQHELENLERRSYGGLHPDDEIGVSQKERDRAREQAERRYPLE